MNNIQKNYKKQINSAIKKLERKAKRGEGPLSNNLYRLRFYSNLPSEEKPNIFTRFITFIYKSIYYLFLFIFFIILVLLIISIFN